MLRLSTSFSKKVPVEGQEFSSQSYHASVELELSDALQPAEIRTRIHDTFAVVRDAVVGEQRRAGQLASSPAVVPSAIWSRAEAKRVRGSSPG